MEKVKIAICGACLVIVAILGYCYISEKQNEKYEYIVNSAISNIVDTVIEKYPDVREEEILNILRNTKNNKTNILKKYGYLDNENYIKKLEDEKNVDRKINILYISIFGIVIILIVIYYNNKKEIRIREVNQYLNEVNRGNYKLKIEENGEDEISRLRNELYKTTILLRETAENSEKEKVSLSNSLADISHQIKTPITSMRIMLDNIEDNPNMDSKTRVEFIKEISKQVDWISSLVVSLLKLAKFDAGAIVMKNEEINVRNLIDKAVSNLAIILDVKNIKIISNIDEAATINADYNWQLEAITNIIKNAVEHSSDNSNIYINVENTSVFVKIQIKDEGEGIGKKDINHIFERFYKSKNSSENSIGIGLSLAKTIIEKANGYIKVESEDGKGTMKLMLIEDEKKEQDKFKKLAEKMNDVTFVKITNSTEEGIKCLKENDIDGVILDLELNSGTGNGFEFLEKLKITKLSKIPKIVVTTNVYSDSVYDYLHQNKVDFIFYKKQENYNVENVINTLLLLNNYTNTASTDIKEIEEEKAKQEKLIAEKVNYELDLIGIASHLQGRKYLFDAITYLLSEEGENSQVSINQYLLSKHKRPTSTINRAMQNAIVRAWRVTAIEDLEKLYTAHINYNTGVPTPVEFIYYYVDKIKKEI